MLRLRAIATAGVVIAALAALSPSALTAQGVTTGAVTGVVTDESGQGVENAQIQVTNRATGYTTGTLTRGGGRYFVQGLEISNRYALTVRLLGYAPQTIENVNVVLGTATPLLGGEDAVRINLSLEALHSMTAKLPRIAVERPARAIGKDTLTAMQSGIYFGYVGLIEGIVARIQSEFGVPLEIGKGRIVRQGTVKELCASPG